MDIIHDDGFQSFATEIWQIGPKCHSDKRNGNELFVCGKNGLQRPLLATAVLKLYYNFKTILLDYRRQKT